MKIRRIGFLLIPLSIIIVFKLDLWLGLFTLLLGLVILTASPITIRLPEKPSQDPDKKELETVKRKLKKEISKLDVREVYILVRNGDIIWKTKAYLTKDGEILDKKGQRLWKLEPKQLEPYIFKEKWSAKPCFILDANTQVVYQFEDPPKDVKTGKLNPVVLNPKTLYSYIASHSIQKLLGKITVSKTEAILYMFTGMVVIILMIFFFMPLLGHEIIIR